VYLLRLRTSSRPPFWVGCGRRSRPDIDFPVSMVFPRFALLVSDFWRFLPPPFGPQQVSSDPRFLRRGDRCFLVLPPISPNFRPHIVPLTLRVQYHLGLSWVFSRSPALAMPNMRIRVLGPVPVCVFFSLFPFPLTSYTLPSSGIFCKKSSLLRSGFLLRPFFLLKSRLRITGQGSFLGIFFLPFFFFFLAFCADSGPPLFFLSSKSVAVRTPSSHFCLFPFFLPSIEPSPFRHPGKPSAGRRLSRPAVFSFVFVVVVSRFGRSELVTKLFVLLFRFSFPPFFVPWRSP